MDKLKRLSLPTIITLLQAILIHVGSSPTITSAELSNPFHSSWMGPNHTRYDFIFNIQEPLKNDFHVDSISGNYLDNQTSLCVGYSACLLENGRFVNSYHLNQTKSNIHHSVFADAKVASQQKNTSGALCLNGGEIILSHYCSTSWNPPVHLYRSQCGHSFEWHSPRSCPLNSTNYEKPCYVYSTDGKLVDLTNLILSDGSSYDADISSYNTTIKRFTFNVCNEANDSCGPNVSSCYSDGANSIEGGYLNLTTIRYNQKAASVSVTSLGQYNEACADKRVRTELKFICLNKPGMKTGPKLVTSSGCNNIIEWPTIYACSIADIQVPAAKCALKYDALGIDIKIKDLTNNADYIEVPNLDINGTKSSMLFGLCSGIKKTRLACEGKQNSFTSACLIDKSKTAEALGTANTSIVGNILKSTIRLSDDRLYWESLVENKTCLLSTNGNLEIRRSVGARIEFFCSHDDQTLPTFLDFIGCTYVFEWGSKHMCLETFGGHLSSRLGVGPVRPTPHLSDKELKIDIEQPHVPALEKHTNTAKNSEEVIGHAAGQDGDGKSDYKSGQPSGATSTRTTPKPKLNPPMENRGPSKMNNVHKFFMISLIGLSLGAFIVVIFILDKKTRLRVPMSALRRRTGQAFQPPPVPYSRVDQFNDCLDL